MLLVILVPACPSSAFKTVQSAILSCSVQLFVSSSSVLLQSSGSASLAVVWLSDATSPSSDLRYDEKPELYGLDSIFP